MDIKLNEKEQKALNELAKQKGMTPEQVLKQALRFYQTVEVRLAGGQITENQIRDLLSHPELRKYQGVGQLDE